MPPMPGWDADDLVIGEAVALELPAAGVGMRMLSALVDVVVLVLVGGAVTMVVGLAAPAMDEATMTAVSLLTVVAVLIGWPAALETLTRGRTLGKAVCGLRTVRDDAGPIGGRHALTRALIGVVEVYLLSGAPALVSALVSEKSKRLGDHAAGTFVIRDRVRLPAAQHVAMPVTLTHWASHADLGTLPEGWALAARQVIQRHESFTPDAQAALARELVAEALGQVSPPPPSGACDADVLRALLAERRGRDAARLAREAQLRSRLFGGSSAPTSPR